MKKATTTSWYGNSGIPDELEEDDWVVVVALLEDGVVETWVDWVAELVTDVVGGMVDDVVVVDEVPTSDTTETVPSIEFAEKTSPLAES